MRIVPDTVMTVRKLEELSCRDFAVLIKAVEDQGLRLRFYVRPEAKEHSDPTRDPTRSQEPKALPPSR